MPAIPFPLASALSNDLEADAGAFALAGGDVAFVVSPAPSVYIGNAVIVAARVSSAGQPGVTHNAAAASGANTVVTPGTLQVIVGGSARSGVVT